jgi:tRNA(His) 5'-end guanylyltransferase
MPVCTQRTYRQRDRLSHLQKFDGPFGAWFHFEKKKKKKLWEPTSVDVRVVLLAEDDTMGEYLHFYIKFKNS